MEVDGPGPCQRSPGLCWCEAFTRAEKAEPRTKVTSKADRASLEPCCKASWSSSAGFLTHIRQKCPPQQSPYSALTSHLTPTFQRDFPSSWSSKNWLLTHERCRLFLVCQEVGLPVLAVTTLSLRFVLNSLPSEMLCVWKFFSNSFSDCLNR